jgi:phenylalanyl-tRNA synthetase beta chain
MKVPINWLKDYVDLPDDLSQWSTKMTSIGHMQDGPAKEIAGDSVYDFEIRQNRSDCLSMLGIARESAVVLNTQLENPYTNLPELLNISAGIKVEINNSDICYRFNTVTIEGVKIAPSPQWLVDKLQAYGIKAINNIVDITNFVMVELGEPLHAYDRREIKNDHIIIRRATNGEQITVLGEKEIELTSDDLVIADPEKILAIAGIIGGHHSSIKEDTTSIILEDATYNQASIRRTSIRHSLRTEASLRHEKFLHAELAGWGLRRALALILEIAGGRVVDHTDAYPVKPQEIKIHFTEKNLKRVGYAVPMDEVKRILAALEFTFNQINENELDVTPPYYRTDIELEEDIIEEVLRIFGYDNIPEQLPSTPPPKDIQSRQFMLEEKIKDILVTAGYDEQITDPLTKEQTPEHDPVVLQNSLNSEKTMLRTTLKHNLLRVTENQRKYRKRQVQVFETGNIYYVNHAQILDKNQPKADLTRMTYIKYKEQRMLGLVVSGKDVTYFHLKGVIELLYERMGVNYDENKIKIEKINSIEPTYFAEFSINDIELKEYVARPLYAHVQSIIQDISLFVPKKTKVGELLKDVKINSELIKKVTLVEDREVEDKRSLLINIIFRSSDELNISHEDIEPIKQKIIKVLEEKYKAKLRIN